jgi:hypothetical protein
MALGRYTQIYFMPPISPISKGEMLARRLDTSQEQKALVPRPSNERLSAAASVCSKKLL